MCLKFSKPINRRRKVLLLRPKIDELNTKEGCLQCFKWELINYLSKCLKGFHPRKEMNILENYAKKKQKISDTY